VIPIRDFTPLPTEARGAVLSIGNFDGVHRGHRVLLERVRALANQLGGPALALTFDPHPLALLKPDRVPATLTRLARRVQLLRQAGMDEVAVFQTGPWLLNLTAREFFDRVLIRQFQARGIVEGPNFMFGKDRGGDPERLAGWCKESGVVFEVVAAVREGTVGFEAWRPSENDPRLLEPSKQAGSQGDPFHAPVSSSRIRGLIDAGRVEEAAHWLGRPHRLEGRVVGGAQRGRELGFPTANLEAIVEMIPADGVYAALAHVGPHQRDLDADPTGRLAEEWESGRLAPSLLRAAAVHVGPNVTFGVNQRSVEAFLLDFQGDLYGHRLALDLIAQIRHSQKFDSVEELIARMNVDVELTRALTLQPLAEAAWERRTNLQ